MGDIRIATRRSKLALRQAAEVAARLREKHRDIEVDIVEITSAGDRDRVSPVTILTEVGAFVRAVQMAVLDGVADIAVHSCKDLPVDGPSSLVAYYLPREAPWDVLCGARLEDLADGAVVGTGSPRRAAQIALLRPDLNIEGIRGNVDTRLEAVSNGKFDAVVLAAAGLNRIDREDAIDYTFSLSEMVPAPGQAAIVAEAMGGSASCDVLSLLDDADCRLEVEAERSLLGLTGAGCRSAMGALARAGSRSLTMTAFVSDDDGPRRTSATGSSPLDLAKAIQTGLGL